MIMFTFSTIMIIVIALLIASFFIGLQYFLQRKRKFGFTLMGIPILFSLIVIGAFYWFFAPTSPDALAISYKEQDGSIVLTGKWKERIDPYSLGIDYLIMYTENDHPVQMIAHKSGNWKSERKYLDQYVRELVKEDQETPHNMQAQIFDIHVEKKFEIKFKLPDEIDREKVVFQYVHLVDEPMGRMEYWIKTMSLR